MITLRKHWFMELVQKGIDFMGGVVTDPNPYATSSPTVFIGTTTHADNTTTNDNSPDTENLTDYHTDQA